MLSKQRLLHLRVQQDGLLYENVPILWCADTIWIEGTLKLPVGARNKAEYRLHLADGKQVQATHLKQIDNSERFRLIFRLPPPANTTSAVVRWRQHEVGTIELPVVSKEEYSQHLQLDGAFSQIWENGTTNMGGTFISGQNHGWIIHTTIQHRVGLYGLSELPIVLELSHEADVPHHWDLVLPKHLLRGKSAQVPIFLPRLPKKAINYHATWSVAGDVRHSQRLQLLTAKQFVANLRLISQVMVGTHSQYPVFLLGSTSPRGTGKFGYELIFQASKEMPPVPQTGQCTMENGLLVIRGTELTVDQFRGDHRYWLLIEGRQITELTPTSAPVVKFDAEGGFSTIFDADFTWNDAADEELYDRLSKIMNENS
ncbi:MAG: hypothetical protein R3B84_02175 [Zavarzinella sp.]